MYICWFKCSMAVVFAYDCILPHWGILRRRCLIAGQWILPCTATPVLLSSPVLLPRIVVLLPHTQQPCNGDIVFIIHNWSCLWGGKREKNYKNLVLIVLRGGPKIIHWWIWKHWQLIGDLLPITISNCTRTKSGLKFPVLRWNEVVMNGLVWFQIGRTVELVLTVIEK